MAALRSTPLFIAGSWAVACATALGLSACRPATGGDTEFWAPSPGAVGEGEGGSGGAAAAAGAGGAGQAAASSGTAASSGAVASSSSAASSSASGMQPAGDPTLSVDFTTVTFKGKYSPRNVGAAWITDGNDKFVKSLEVWAVKRIKYLTKWKGSSAGNEVDAITSATKSSHGPHHLTWDMTDVGGNVVPDGAYRLYVEFTEYDGNGKWTSIDFTKGAAKDDISPPDLANFVSQHVVFTP
ncbi:MAG: DUF2271 domain-containing protein [Minicystis sp.]